MILVLVISYNYINNREEANSLYFLKIYLETYNTSREVYLRD